MSCYSTRLQVTRAIRAQIVSRSQVRWFSQVLSVHKKLSAVDAHQPLRFCNTLTPGCSAMVTVHAAQAECLTQLADRR